MSLGGGRPAAKSASFSHRGRKQIRKLGKTVDALQAKEVQRAKGIGAPFILTRLDPPCTTYEQAVHVVDYGGVVFGRRKSLWLIGMALSNPLCLRCVDERSLQFFAGEYFNAQQQPGLSIIRVGQINRASPSRHIEPSV